MDDTQASAALAALGHEARLRIFRLLVRAGRQRLSVGEIAEHTGLAPSTLAHHLSALVEAGLVGQTRVGRSVLSHADFGRMRAVLDHVAEDCCAGLLGEQCAPPSFEATP